MPTPSPRLNWPLKSNGIQMINQHNGYQWIPTLYVMQGLPFALVTAVSPVLYKNYGLGNSDIALFTSLYILPWILKFLLAPALENIASKKKLIIFSQLSIAIFTFLLATSFYITNWFLISVVIFFIIAFLASIHDINVDGLYLEVLTYKEQAQFIGIRSLFYQIGRLLCQGILLMGVGFFVLYFGTNYTWSIAFCILSLLISIFAFYHLKFLPQPYQSNLATNESNKLFKMGRSYQQVFQNFKEIPNLMSITIFILFYNFPESQLVKIVPLFMMDKVSQGGLNLEVDTVGFIYGGIGIVSMLIGITLSGFILARLSLKKCLVPFTLVSLLCNLPFVLLTFYPPHSILYITVCVSISTFGSGLVNGAYMLYIVELFAKRNSAMSLYATATAMMLLGAMIAGSISGYLQYFLGYTGFFIWIILASIGIIYLAIYNVKNNL